MKRVYTLYRVSTKKQVKIVYDTDTNKDDLPMQRQACREFASRREDWTIVREFEEKGVSGFKVSANDRDAIQELKEAALNCEFDILLVFMFDRIGRIDDETPFVVEWFAKHGIEVWSVREGEQRFDSHVDKLTNYIRFWQASGESEKTSMRIKTRLHQLTMEGVYTAGRPPFGYKLVGTGKKNNKGREINVMEIDEAESETVRMIFSKTINEGYGSFRLANICNSMKIKTHNGSEFQSNTIRRILKNRIYCGYIVSGEAISPKQENLVIISEDDYERAQKIMKQRDVKNDEKRKIALNTKGKALMSGLIFCGHCGGRLNVIHYKNKRIRRDGSFYYDEQIKYSCYHKSRKLNDCDGQATYSADKIDEIVCEFIKSIFANMREAPDEIFLQESFKRYNSGNKARQKNLQNDIDKSNAQLAKLQLEIGKSLTGESAFSMDDLSSAILNLKSHIEECKEQLDKLQEEERRGESAIENIKPAYRKFQSWADEFEEATFEQKKMIVGELINHVEITKDYNINVVLNVTYQQFCENWDKISGMTVA